MRVYSKKSLFFNLGGAGVVLFWLVMIATLVKEVEFGGWTFASNHAETPQVTLDSPQREWKEIYLKDKKVGYAVNLIKPVEGGFFIQDEIFLRFNLMGIANGVETLTQSQTDKQFRLKSFRFRMRSGVVTFSASGRIADGELVVSTGKGTDSRTKRIPLNGATPLMGAGLGHFFKSQKIRLGETFTLPVFDPSAMAHKEATFRVVGRESIRVNQATYVAHRLETELWGQRMSFWLDESGSTLKEEGFLGLTAIKSSAANAPRGLENGGGGDLDLYELTAITPDKDLREPARMKYLRVRLSGIEEGDLVPADLNSGRQSFSDGVMEVTREALPASPNYLLPDGPEDEALGRFLQPAFNIESDEEVIIAKAHQITGNDRRPLAVCRKLLNWVYHHLEKRPVASIPSALEVLRTGVGDCNEHATLLTALLRAAGVPARMSSGLVYTRGKFFYHAWTEAYVGSWVTLDATMNQIPVDVTHIKLVQGNLDKQVGITGLIGKLRVAVLEYRYD
jgi:hypothetical protein